MVVLSLIFLTLRVSYYDLEEVLVPQHNVDDESPAPTSGCCVGCRGRRVAPKSNVGEIKVDKKKLEALEAERAKKVEDAEKEREAKATVAAAAPSNIEESKKDDDDDESRSNESGSFDETVLRD